LLSNSQEYYIVEYTELTPLHCQKLPITCSNTWNIYREKTKAAANKAAAATSRAAQRTKLKTEIMALNRDIRSAKAAWGIQAFELVCGGDLAGAQRLANEKKGNIDKWKASIASKKAEIDRLNAEAAAAGEKAPPPEKDVDEDPDGNVVI
jgi:hypothetical protein